jgi:hypothetical protein
MEVRYCLFPYFVVRRRLNRLFPCHRREEQHDDQLLHELLRCVKALSTSVIGSHAIRSCSPNPFVPLINLLFTDKKPGDVPTRQIMTELVLLLFELYPTRPSFASSSQQPTRWTAEADASGESRCPVESEFELPREYRSVPEMVRTLLVGPEKDADIVDFVKVARRPKIFKTYLTEVSDIWSAPYLLKRIHDYIAEISWPIVLVLAEITFGCSVMRTGSGGSM